MNRPTDEEIIQQMRDKSTRQVLGEFVTALGQLVIHLNIDYDICDLAINFHGRTMRVDVAELTPDGLHLSAWLLALNANILDASFGARVDLPGAAGGTVQ